MDDLASKLAVIKLDTKPFSLATFLTIYNKANYECYINRMEGAKLLHDWLTSNATIPLELNVAKYPKISEANFKIPSILLGYELYELAKIIEPSSTNLHRISRAILFTVVDTLV